MIACIFSNLISWYYVDGKSIMFFLWVPTYNSIFLMRWLRSLNLHVQEIIDASSSEIEIDRPRVCLSIDRSTDRHTDRRTHSVTLRSDSIKFLFFYCSWKEKVYHAIQRSLLDKMSRTLPGNSGFTVASPFWTASKVPKTKRSSRFSEWSLFAVMS